MKMTSMEIEKVLCPACFSSDICVSEEDEENLWCSLCLTDFYANGEIVKFHTDFGAVSAGINAMRRYRNELQIRMISFGTYLLSVKKRLLG